MQARSTRVDACSESAGRHPNSEVCLLPGTLAPTIPRGASRKLESLRRLLLHASWGRGHDTTTSDVREAAGRTDAFAHRQSRGPAPRRPVAAPAGRATTCRGPLDRPTGPLPSGGRPPGGRRQATGACGLPKAVNPLHRDWHRYGCRRTQPHRHGAARRRQQCAPCHSTNNTRPHRGKQNQAALASAASTAPQRSRGRQPATQHMGAQCDRSWRVLTRHRTHCAGYTIPRVAPHTARVITRTDVATHTARVTTRTDAKPVAVLRCSVQATRRHRKAQRRNSILRLPVCRT